MKTKLRRERSSEPNGTTPKPEPPPGGLVALQWCLFASGAAALIYQVTWTKSLGLLFGYTAYATATVLAVFMGGLALGSFWIGKWCESRSDSIRFYAWLEFGVAATGALSVAGLAGIRALYLHAFPILAGSRFAQLSFRLFAAAVVLGVPSFLMGGTLPVLVRGVVRQSRELGLRVSRFYTINTLGAALGTLAAGFLLIPAIGLRFTMVVAAVLNVAAGAFALRIAQTEIAGKFTPPVADSRKKQAIPAPSRARFLLAAFALVGFTAIAYEIAWTRLLVTILGSSTYSFTLILATFLLGIVVGSAIFEKRFGRKRPVVNLTFAWTQTSIAAAALLFLKFFRHLPELIPPLLRATSSGFPGLVFVQFITCALAMLPVAIVFGFNFPAVVTLVAAVSEEKKCASMVGRAYAANTAGAIAGALLAGFVLLPLFGGFRLVALAAGINVLLAFILFVRDPDKSWAIVIANATILSLLIYAGSANAFYSRTVAGFGAVLYGNYHGQRLTVEEMADLEEVVFFDDGLNATIAVTRTENYLALKTNGKVDASNLDSSTQLLLGDLGAIFHPHPRRVLVIGLGGGMTASAVSRFSDVERIDCLEIEPAVFRAQGSLMRLNRGVLADPRFHLIFDDARNFIQTTREHYDLIISEPSNPWIAGIASLYTAEFYAALRQRLNPHGIFLQWVQAYGMEPDDFRMILASLTPEFADVSLWRSGGRDYLLLARTMRGELSFARARRAWGDPLLNQDFRELRLAAPESWPVYFHLADGQVRSLAAGAELNTDDRTQLEYRAPKRLLGEEWTEKLTQIISDSETELLPPDLNPADIPSARLASAESAVELNDSRAAGWIAAAKPVAPRTRIGYLEGRIALQRNQLSEAARLFSEALKEGANHINALYWLGITEARLGSFQQAASHFEEILRDFPKHKEALLALVRLAEQAKEWDKAISFQQRLIEAEQGGDSSASCKLGDLFLRKRDLLSAELPLREGLQRDPYAFLCHRELGELLRASNRLSEAEVELQFVVKHFPETDPKTFSSLALLYLAQGRKTEAENAIAKGRKLFPQDRLLSQLPAN
jgi:spermidine synthase